ncbi:NAD(P)H-binding protein [Hymenobacter sp. BT635]|uniref:NAD(P)H-binding protein n=1 Tax=Hymenobacter nitidus TaxID=2880929 RepID=A0ABS8AH93_9BACT|nr:NAD(P)H-binding protein [Hymenobacter nitidus]MCB2379469.1 NAD(P)H-binding protein [Hymenobacter nitidus]
MTAPTPSALPTIAVLGCGWLGLPLAKSLVAAGYPVVGSTTTPKQLLTLRDAGITPYLLRLGPDFSATDADTLRAMLSGVDVLVLNIPPSKVGPGGYPALLRPVGSAVAATGVKQVLFVSSTSVYPDEPRRMSEADAVASAEAASDLLRAEGQFMSAQGQWQTTVVRLSGLMGPDRPPGRFLAGRQDVPNGDAPVNLIHLDDCIGLLISIIRQQRWGYTFNASAAQHLPRREFYAAAARQLGLDTPVFQAVSAGGKIIDSTLIRQTLHYEFAHDDLLAALAHC